MWVKKFPTSTMLASIKYSRGSLEILDQLLLPFETRYERVENSSQGYNVIKSMKVRGAPLIAIVGMLSLAVELGSCSKFESPKAEFDYIQARLVELRKSRPTAVNLGKAIDEIMELIKNSSSPTVLFVEYAENMLEKDLLDNMAIGRIGKEFLNSLFNNRPIKVLTHCNTGSLATCGWGTALGIIRDLKKSNLIEHAYCTETRPYNQGSRLTAYELVQEEIPSTLVCDSMVSLLIQEKNIDCIIIGADRVAKNGDTCNKIGSLQLAIIAQYYQIPFVVAAPSTSIDLSTINGKMIEIEYRSGKEVTFVKGLMEGEIKQVEVGARDIKVWNPAFDVVPSALITAIITEKECLNKSVGSSEFALE